MRVTMPSVAIALSVCSLALLPSYADDSPWAQLEGYRCEAVATGDTSSGPGPVAMVVCQIEDGPGPFGSYLLHAPLVAVASPALDSLLNLLSTADKTRHDTSQQRHRAVVRKPTP